MITAKEAAAKSAGSATQLEKSLTQVEGAISYEAGLGRRMALISRLPASEAEELISRLGQLGYTTTRMAGSPGTFTLKVEW